MSLHFCLLHQTHQAAMNHVSVTVFEDHSKMSFPFLLIRTMVTKGAGIMGEVGGMREVASTDMSASCERARCTWSKMASLPIRT